MGRRGCHTCKWGMRPSSEIVGRCTGCFPGAANWEGYDISPCEKCGSLRGLLEKINFRAHDFEARSVPTPYCYECHEYDPVPISEDVNEGRRIEG